MAYICIKCGKKIKSVEGSARCTFCGGRILKKERPNLAKEISTD
ncbi:MAG: DNA-directed RNA polymerase subunit P [Candidatus Marsarchaeota archaeon]|nr:DNA-directed RNA polymerase subunit P [Candidatus Marsarchaeota archaeon]